MEFCEAVIDESGYFPLLFYHICTIIMFELISFNIGASYKTNRNRKKML